MTQIRFKSYEHQDQNLDLSGTHYHARIQAFKGGVWRVLIYHRPQDQHKGSWSISDEHPTQSFQCHEQDNLLLLSQGEARLSLQLNPFCIDWQGLQQQSFFTEAIQSMWQDLPKAYTGPHDSHEHPVRDKLDGLPLGAGIKMACHLQPEADFYGLGERTGYLAKRGRRWQNWTTDEFWHSPQADPLYQSHPFVIQRQGNQFIGLYLDESWYSCFDLGFTAPEEWTLCNAGPTFDLYLIPGPDPQSILTRYTQMTGKAPMPPLWALGKHQCRWSYPDQQTVLEVAQQYRKHGYPLDALWLDIDYMDSYKVFSFSSQRFPNPKQLSQGLLDMGIRTVAIVDPGVKIQSDYEIYEQGNKIQAWVRDHKDEPLVGAVWPEPVVWPDFVQPDVRHWWGLAHRFYLDQGIAGIWNDMNEPAAFKWEGKTLPLNARQGAYSHAEVHNLYGLQMAQATYQGLQSLDPEQRPFVLTRSGCPGIQKYAWVWTGDNASYWEHLEMSIPMLLNLGLSGIPFVGADIGGFSGNCDGELLAAWTWLGVCYPFMRNHAGKGSRRQEPWQFGEPWASIIKEAILFRYQLLPYLYTLSWQATQHGLPLMRPLLLDYPDDPETHYLSDEFLLGPDLLVAPVTRPAQSRRLIYLPAGQWIDFWNQHIYPGKQWIQIELQRCRMGLFQRMGSAIPLTSPQMHTDSAEWNELIWRVAPAKTIQGSLYSDSGNGVVKSHCENLSGQCTGQNVEIHFDPGSRKVTYQLPDGFYLL